MNPRPTTIAPEVIACIGTGRDPSAEEVLRVADRIWTDIRGSRSAFAWGDLTPGSADRLLTLRAAQVALAGT